jgi:cell shape-determining protein MreC
MDAAQILIILVVGVLAFVLLILGVQIFFILREFKNTISKVNKVLDDTGVITESVATPVANLSNILTSVKAGAALLKLFQKKHAKVRDSEEE